jgi:hypothetical protein
VVVACGAAAVALLMPWPVLRVIARLGRPRLVYYLAHAVLICPRTGETYAGAVLLSAVALAHRGGATRDERAWLWGRLAREERALGTFGAASAILLLLDARAARDEGRTADASGASALARAVLGTITYGSPAGAPRPVRKLSQELLALANASQGEWGLVGSLPARGLTATTRTLRAYARERLIEADDGKLAGRPEASALAGALFARRSRPKSVPFDQAREKARAAYLALARGEAVGVHDTLSMLHVFDALLSPSFEHTAVPEEIRDDEALVEAIQEEVAIAVAEVLEPHAPPIFALTTPGPISARVYEKLESRLFDELSRVISPLHERTQHGHVARHALFHPPPRRDYGACEARPLGLALRISDEHTRGYREQQAQRKR